jgi:hypothetical protein
VDGTGVDGQIGGDLLVRPIAVGHADDLELVPELAVGRLTERLSAIGLGETDEDHGRGGSEDQ